MQVHPSKEYKRDLKRLVLSDALISTEYIEVMYCLSSIGKKVKTST